MNSEDHNLESGKSLDAARLRVEIDRSCRWPVMTWYVSSVIWLVFGSLLALVASIKMHTPGFMDNSEWLTFGRVRPAHLNTVAYGWASMSGMGTLLWLMARLCRRTLLWGNAIIVVAIFWNLLIAIGTWQILIGNGTSIEWLEFPAWVALPIGLVFVGLIVWTIRMLMTRREQMKPTRMQVRKSRIRLRSGSARFASS